MNYTKIACDTRSLDGLLEKGDRLSIKTDETRWWKKLIYSLVFKRPPARTVYVYVDEVFDGYVTVSESRNGK